MSTGTQPDQEKVIEADLCIIGAGSGGLSVAAGAAQMGARTVLFEAGKMGGDCLNTGCVPSKALLAAAHAAQAQRSSGAFGITPVAAPEVNFQAVHDHVHEVIAGIAPHDSVERFEELGVQVVQARAKFTGKREISGGGVRVRFRHAVIATGSHPVIPAIPGLSELPFLTNESLFDVRDLPDHLMVIGGGPIGCEMAQAFRRLGARVTILQRSRLLPADDPELVAILRRKLEEEGIEIHEQADIRAAGQREDGTLTLEVNRSGERLILEGSHILVAAGRQPSLHGLDQDKAGIRITEKGIQVNRCLRTSNPAVFAIGDCIGQHLFTHMAGYHAGIVIRNALFRMPAKVNLTAVPRVTYTDPELAQVGMSEAEARQKWGDRLKILDWSYKDNDRARAERRTEGMVRILVSPRGYLLGASIVGLQAGELIQMWSLAISSRMKIGPMASLISPYPTLSEVNKRVAGSWYTPMLFSERTRKIVRFLSRF